MKFKTIKSGLFNITNVGIESDKLRYFPNPQNSSLRVYVRANGPHLVILTRNHFLITAKNIHYIKNLADPFNLKIISSFLQKLLTAKNTERQKVKWIAKLFSTRVVQW